MYVNALYHAIPNLHTPWIMGMIKTKADHVMRHAMPETVASAGWYFFCLSALVMERSWKVTAPKMFTTGSTDAREIFGKS